MTQQLVPTLIQDNFSTGTFSGTFEAITLFIDLSGFTPLTETLMQHRRDGAEALTQALYSVFAPCVHQVYVHGGFISTYAGDAFTAIFPITEHLNTAQHALASAFFVQKFFQEDGRVHTPYGDFQLEVKVGLGSGPVNWGVIGRDGQHTYYFRGDGINACAHAEQHADKGQIVATSELQSLFSDYVRFESHMPDYILLKQFLGEPVPELSPVRLLTATELAPFAPDSVLFMETSGEFRDVGVVFISIDDPDNDTVIDSFISKALVVCNQYGGYFRHVDFGDKGAVIVLIFGAPIAHENDIERAANCLIALRDIDLPIRWRAGLTFGLTYAGFMGGVERSDYASIGDIVNLAARLAMKSEWGDIWTTSRVQSALSNQGFQLTYLDAISFKGKSELTEVYQLTDKQISFSKEPTRVVLVGREQEISALNVAVQPILQGNFGGIVYIFGEAGIGKSQLVSEFHHQLAPNDALLWCYLPADEILRQSYNPLRYFLRYYFGQQAEVSAEINRERFDTTLNDLLNSPEVLRADSIRSTLDRTRSFIGALIDLRWDGSIYELVEPTLRTENTQIAIKSLFLAEALRHPVILHFEDIHWLDDDTRSIVVNLTRNMTGYPVLILMSSRYNDDGSPVTIPDVDPDSPVREINLQSFDVEDVRRQVSTLLSGDIDHRLSTYLHDKTAGNPFFVEQLVYHLRDLHLLEENDNLWQMRQVELTEVPSTIGAVLVSRLDRLTKEVKQIVQTAAVLGKEFEINILSTMLRDTPDVDLRVKEAEAQSIWTALSRILYLFKHALMRDAAYDMQLRAHLRELHALAANAIRELYKGELSSRFADIAYHFGKAGDLPNEREYSLLAGRVAAVEANADAVRFLARAYELTPEDDLETRYEILQEREKVLDLRADRQSQHEVIEDMLRIADQLADHQKHLKSRVRLASYYESIGEFDKSYPILEEVESASENDLQIKALAKFALVSGLTRQRRADEVLSHLIEAVDLFRQIGDISSQYHTLSALSNVYLRMGKFDEAIATLNQSEELQVQTSDEHIHGKVLQSLGGIAQYQGRFADAENYYAQSYDIMVKYGDRRNQAACITNRGGIAYNTGDFESAYKYFLDAQHIFREAGDLSYVVQLTHNLAAVAVQRHNYEDAINQLEAGIRLGMQIDNVPSIGHMTDTLGNIYLILGEYERAKGHFNKALGIIRSIQDKLIELHILGASGLIEFFVGNYSSALDLAEKILAGSLNTDFAYMSPLGYRVKGRVLLEMGNPGDSKEAYQKALEVEEARNETYLLPENWAGMARAAMAQGHVDEALGYVESSIAVMKELPDLPGTTETFLIYVTCFNVLEAAGRIEQASEILQQGHEHLQVRAAKLKDPDLKHSYLNNVIANRTLASLWEARNPA